MELGDAILEIETFVWNLDGLWQVTAWLLRHET